MRIDHTVETKLSRSARVRQLESMFDVPAAEKTRLRWQGELPIESFEWQIGLIVGPSGSGKSTLLRQCFGEPWVPKWKAASVIDDFAKSSSMEAITATCSAVGFNTVPAWMRPHAVLSNGEKFRADLARQLLESPQRPILIDEFTSVVDRQVAKIGAHAVQKYVRKNALQLVAATCHYDVIDWLQPDWILEPGAMKFRRGRLRQRPPLEVEIAPVDRAAWRHFAPFHYLSAELAHAARCFGLFVDGEITTFCGVLNRPHATARNVYGVSRVVTLPDWQGLGLAFVLVEALAGAYRTFGWRFRNYPAHPAFVRAHDRSPRWLLAKRPGQYSPRKGDTSTTSGTFGGRPCAVFEYVGEPLPIEQARRLLSFYHEWARG